MGFFCGHMVHSNFVNLRLSSLEFEDETDLVRKMKPCGYELGNCEILKLQCYKEFQTTKNSKLLKKSH
jgi:hypothetical protein